MSNKLKIQKLLDAGHSKALRDQIIEFVGTSKPRMKALMSFFFHENLRYNQKASWPIGYIGCRHEALIAPYLPQMVKALDNPAHDAQVRNTLRIFEDIDIPEEVEGQLCDKCFNYIMDVKYAVAIRAFAMTVLHKIVKKYPDLQQEFIAIIKEQMPHGTAAIKVRGRKILKDLDN